MLQVRNVTGLAEKIMIMPLVEDYPLYRYDSLCRSYSVCIYLAQLK